MGRASASVVSRALAGFPSGVAVLQLTDTRLWLTEHDDPFAELTLADDGAVEVRPSCHCTPLWAARLCAALATAGLAIRVASEVFLQQHDGRVVYGADAEDYFKWYADANVLLQYQHTVVKWAS